MHVVILGAGFGGLELATSLSETLGDAIALTLIDKSDHFVFGYSKFDILFGGEAPEAVRLPYSALTKAGLTFRQETIRAIDPDQKRVVTDRTTYEADILVVALGADYDLDHTPGLRAFGNEFYTVAGAARARSAITTFQGGTAVIAVVTPHYKCPPAPSEAAFLLHDNLISRGLREKTNLMVISPFPTPLPVTPELGATFQAAYDERAITFKGNTKIAAITDAGKAIVTESGETIATDLILSVPLHVAPQVVLDSGMTENGWIPTDKYTLQSRYPDVYALGDVASVGVPRAGIFSEGQAKIVASQIIARVRKQDPSARYQGNGMCYVEFGDHTVGKVDVDFLSGPQQQATFYAATRDLRKEKSAFGSDRRARWFGLP